MFVNGEAVAQVGKECEFSADAGFFRVWARVVRHLAQDHRQVIG
jgi:hypothetical protein